MRFVSAVAATLLSVGTTTTTTTVDAHSGGTVSEYASSMVDHAKDGAVTLVSGNEGGDADSIVTALMYAYLLSTHEVHGDTNPVSYNKFVREDMAMRAETLLILEAAGVDWEGLVYADDLEAADLIARTTEVVLTDHCSADSTLIHLGDKVVQILDHHTDLNDHLHVTGDDRVIAFDETTGKATAASAATVIAEEYLKRSNGLELLAAEDGAIARALLSVILLDGSNKLVSAGGKLTPRDEAALAVLQPLTGLDDEAATALYEQLKAAKTDEAMWETKSAAQILRYDFKRFTSADGARTVGISSSPASLASLTAKEDWLDSLAGRAAEYDLYVVMTKMTRADGEKGKELLLTACTAELVADAAAFFAAYDNGLLQMVATTAAPVPDYSLAFDQTNTDPSRKVVGPISQRFLDTLTEAPDCSGASGCFGGVKGVTYLSDDDKCNCYSTACTKDTCEGDMGGTWTTACPACDPTACNPLQEETAGADSNPSCTGPPEAIDRFGKKMFRRKLISREIPDIPAEAGVFCHVIFELCPGESQLTHGMDSGFGDYYRLGATAEWQDYKGTAGKTYAGMYKPTGARSYSPVTPLNENTVQLTIKQVVGKEADYGCTAGVDCRYGMSELACMAPIGSYFLLSKRTDHMGYEGTHQAYVPNFERAPGSGPYTINVIGQGVALTELNLVVLSELLKPFSVDGSPSQIHTVNYLWANSYWESAEWMFADTDSTDLSREMIRISGTYGIRFNLMHSISRQSRPEAEWPRTDVNVIGQAFNLTNTTDQDPNIKWFVVGSSGYKRSIYPQILEWGFDMYGCNTAAVSKGYPYCGPNALYDQAAPGSDPNDRERSDLFKYYKAQPTEPGMATVDVTLKFDAYPMDISWTLYNTCNGKEELASGGNYGRPDYQKAITNSYSTPAGSWVLEVSDSHGDGLCCDYGLGNVFIDVNGNEVYRNKMEDPSSALSAEFHSPGGCDGPPVPVKVKIGINIRFDGFPEDVSWELFNTCGGPAGVKVAEGRGFGQDLANQVDGVFGGTVEDGKFLFVIKDSFGDGLCCDYGNGGYEIFYQPDSLFSSSFKMSAEETHEFGSLDSCESTPDDRATFSSDLDTPWCKTVSASGTCTTVGTGLLVGKTVFGEPNGPNTLDECLDGRNGAYKMDESNEAITVMSVGSDMEMTNGPLTGGEKAMIKAYVFAFTNPAVEDVVDFYHASDAYNPSWEYIGTTKPLIGGFGDVKSPTFTLSNGEMQAVRVIVRWVGPGAYTEEVVSCPLGEYNDIDDLAFAVNDGEEEEVGITVASPEALPQGLLSMITEQVVECVGYDSGRCAAADGCEWKNDRCQFS